MIGKIFLMSAALAAVSGSALAADLPSRRAPPVYIQPVPVFTWTGLYVGGQIGYAFGKDGFTYNTQTFGGSYTTVGGYSPNGVIGGAHVGYNLSSQGLFGNLLGAGGVIGVEADVNGTGYSRTSPAFAGSPYGTGTSMPVDGSVRARIGFAVDHALFYVTGGGAIASLRNPYYNVSTFGNTTLGHTRIGYTLGGGIEYAITNNWSVRAEYRYTDFKAYTDYPLAGTAVRHHETDNRVQIGFSYKFSTYAPVAVVAKY